MYSTWRPFSHPMTIIWWKISYFLRRKFWKVIFKTIGSFSPFGESCFILLNKSDKLHLPFCSWSFILCRLYLWFSSGISSFCWGKVRWVCSKKMTHFRWCRPFGPPIHQLIHKPKSPLLLGSNVQNWGIPFASGIWVSFWRTHFAKIKLREIRWILKVWKK